MSGGFGSGFSSGGNAVVKGQAGNAVPLPPVPAPDYVPIHGGQRLPRWREPTEKQGKWLRRIADKVKAHWAKQTRETPLRNAGSRGGLEEAPLPRARLRRERPANPRAASGQLDAADRTGRSR
jgi:hypothetical protein